MSPADRAFAEADRHADLAVAYGLLGVLFVAAIVLVVWAPGVLERRNSRKARNAEREAEAVERWLRKTTNSGPVFRGTDNHGRRVAR